MLYKQDGPLISKEVADQLPLHCLEMHEHGGLLCVGRDDGAVALLELSESLTTSTKVQYTEYHILEPCQRKRSLN